MRASKSTPAPSPEAPQPGRSGAEVLVSAVQRHRDRVLSAAAAIRLAGAAILLVSSLVLWQVAGEDDWSTQVPTLIAYGTLALVTFMTQGRVVMVRLAWVQPLLDVGFAYAVMRTSILLAPTSAQSMAGLSVAVLLLPVALTGIAFRTRTLIVVTLAAAVTNLSLMAQAELTAWPIITATAVLLLAASGSKLARETVEAEITRRLLAESRTRCEDLSGLQKDKDSLLGIIVHDMRSPVNSTLLSLEYLQEQMNRHAVAHNWSEAVADALSSCSNLSDMIAQIGDTTKLETKRMTLHLTVVDACQLLDQAREHTLTHARSKSIALEIDAPGPLPVTVDPRLLLRVFESLITCSIRQTPRGGRILLQTSMNGAEALVAVHRSGPPVPAEQRQAIFEKFQPGEPAKRRLAGWGMGLYFCRLAAEAHGANVAVEDTEGWSSSYVVRLSTLRASPGLAAGENSHRGRATRHARQSETASDLLSTRRTPTSPKTRAALAEFARTVGPLEGELSRLI
jgi:signal transduction histidine kinase